MAKPLIMKDVAEPRQQLGFPEGTTFRGLTVSEMGGCILATVEVGEAQWRGERLFIRAFAEERYREIPWPEGCNSYSDLVISPFNSEAYVLGEHWTERGGDGRGIFHLALPEGAISLAHRARSDGGDTADSADFWWISRLLGMARDGERLMVVRARVVKSGTGCRAVRCAGLFDPRTGMFEKCAELPAVFA